ncbi:MAG: hypothetical protein HPY85_01310 [Anaerolineae bacterium]|nr:hypothetical protein [Anaerolineae bacterium]
MLPTTDFQNDYRHIVDVLANRRPARLPVYEHIISVETMEAVLNTAFGTLASGDTSDREEFFRNYCRFWQVMTYDTVSFEVCITSILPDGGAIMGGKKGPIQSRQDFEQYPWAELPERFWALAHPQFQALRRNLPPGMQAIGGVGNGAFEISEDLVGYEYLAYMQADDPELFADLYNRIGELMAVIWQQFLQDYSDVFCVCRFGDDLGFKTSTLVSPGTIRRHVIPQYEKVISQVKMAGKPFLYHSCGKIFPIMEDVIQLGINAKHSNEDIIAPFDTWIERYGSRIGLFGGIDVDILCQKTPAQITTDVVEKATRFRRTAYGYALGSGNSIPHYVPVDGYMAMIEAAQIIREQEAGR